MKIRNSKVLAGVLAAMLCISITGCGNGRSGSETVALDYGTGVSEDGNYNYELYGMNGNDIKGADPGCFWLSKEEDPVNGGYFYMYMTGWTAKDKDALNSAYFEENKIDALAFMCYRSTDLYRWERCGALPGGYSLVADEEDWCIDDFWAPEVIKSPIDGRYYMYFSAQAKKNYGANGVSSSDFAYDRLYLSVAVSDSPMGPFDVICDTDVKTGKRIPTINFHDGCNTEFDWAAIDVSPFFDDNGDFYLYFNKHEDSNYTHLNGVYGMKMLSMTKPDYSTVVCLSQPNAVTASSVAGQIEENEASGKYFYNEGRVNEGPQMLKHNGKYYLIYSGNGYTSPLYSVHQAIGDSPLGTFTKLGLEEGNPILAAGDLNYVQGTAHQGIIEKDGNMYMIYHRHASVYAMTTRAVCTDRIEWIQNKDGLDVLACNGPSDSLQWLSEDISGYKNLAQTADISVSTGKGVEFLSDKVIPFAPGLQNCVLESTKGNLKITYKWEEPVNIRSVMIYNGLDVNYGFSNISEIRFQLAEKPEWASKEYTYAAIRDLEFPSLYWDKESEKYVAGSPAVAEFDEIKVSELTITISGKDRLIKKDKFGETNTALRIAEIVILGGGNHE